MSDAKHLLVIHLEEPIAEIIKAILIDAGYRCHVAWQEPDIRRALNSGTRFDLLVFHVASLERHHELWSWTTRGAGQGEPLVLIAARDRKRVPEFMLNRCQTYLQVPFSRKQLIATVHEVLSSKPGPASQLGAG